MDESSLAPNPAAAGLTRSQRLDRLPFTRQHGRLLAGSGVGWALDAMDVGLVSFILAALAAQWSLSPGELSAIASIGFVGMAVGASLGGLLADRIGRRQVFALTLLVYGMATGASALVTGLGLLLVLRFLVGLGLGAELPVASTLVSEYAPTRIRGRVVVALEAFWALGWVLAAVIGYLVVPASANGWRWAFALGMVPAAYAIVVRWGLPESVRFLERKGRDDEAETAVRRFEASAGVDPPGPSTPATRDSDGPTTCSAVDHLVVAHLPAAHDRPVADLVRDELLLLRRLHLAADAAGRVGIHPGQVLRVHLDHHAGPAARLRGLRVPDRALGSPTDPEHLPGRIGSERRRLRAGRLRCRPCWPPGWPCPSSTWGPGEPSTR